MGLQATRSKLIKGVFKTCHRLRVFDCLLSAIKKGGASHLPVRPSRPRRSNPAKSYLHKITYKWLYPMRSLFYTKSFCTTTRGCRTSDLRSVNATERCSKIQQIQSICISRMRVGYKIAIAIQKKTLRSMCCYHLPLHLETG